MGEYSLTVVFEIAKPNRKKLLTTGFLPKSPRQSGHTVGRMLGRDLESGPTFKDSFEINDPESIDNLLTTLRVIRLNGANSLLALSFDLPDDKLNLADDLRRAKSRRVQSIAARCLLELDADHYLYAVTASSSSAELGLANNVQDTWMHFGLSRSNIYLSKQIQEELAIRVAVERALISIALDDPTNPILRWARAPWVAYRVRNWSVELLIDKESVQLAFRTLRKSMNLPELREEILERARSWYAAVGTVLAVAAAITGIFSLT